MRYKIPENKILLEQEQKNMVLSASDREVVRIQKALSFVADYADNGEKYNDSPEDAYSALYQIYKEFQLDKDKEGNEIPEDTLFPKENRSRKQFREELEKLWRVMELHSLKEPNQEKEPELADTYRKYQAETARYDAILHEREAEELELDAPLQNLNDNRMFIPIDEKSPYYGDVSGTAYMELQDSWMKLKSRPSAGAVEGTMEQLLSALQPHYLRRSGTGSLLPMTQGEYETIRGLYDRCVTDLNRFPDKEKKRPEYKALHDLILRNQKELNSLSPDQALPPLGEVLHGAKDPVIYLQDTVNHTVGASMSSRETVEYIDENGKLRQGLFTPEKKIGDWRQEAKELLDRYIQNYPKYETYLEKIKNDKNIYERIEAAAFEDADTKKYIEVDRVLDSFDWIRQKDKEGEFKKVFKALGRDIIKPRGRNIILKNIGIHKGESQAERSSAMSDVADALGFPDLLVRNRRVTVKKGDKEIPGVMMDAAGPSALDTDKLPQGHPFFNLTKKEFDNKELLSSLADLQILDYLCGNTDRHASNFFLKMDFSDPNQPRIRGVQGIDNDNSFGSIKEGNIYHLASEKNLKVITGKMAEAIKNMKPEKLEEILQPYNFRKDQIRAAKTRLKTLQDMIKEYEKKGEFKVSYGKLVNKKGTIFVAKTDKDWNSLNLDALIPAEIYANAPTNIFDMADTCRDDLKRYKWLHSGENNNPVDEINRVLVDKTDMKQIQYDEHGLKEMDHKELEKMEAHRAEEYKILHNSRVLFNRHGGQDIDHRTREYREMNDALNSYIEAYKELGKTLQGKENENEAVIAGDVKEQPLKQKKDLKATLKERYEALEQARKNLDQSITNYDKKKHSIFLRGDSKERLLIARKLQQTIRKKPESVKAYESVAKFLEQQKETMEGKTDSQLAAYLSEQIGSKMKLTLQNNIKQLREDDPVRVQGIKALKAQENLWNYSQSVLSEGMLSVKNMTDQGEKADKQKTSLKLMEYEIRKKLTEKPDKNKLYEDMTAIRDYVGKQVEKEKSKIQACDEEIRKVNELLEKTNAKTNVLNPRDAKNQQAAYEKMKVQAAKRLEERWELYGQIDSLMTPENRKTDTMYEQIEAFLPKEKQKGEQEKEEKQEKKAQLTPRHIRDMLNKVYKSELTIASQYQMEKKQEKKQEISKKQKDF